MTESGKDRLKDKKPRIAGTPDIRGQLGAETPLAIGKYSDKEIEAIKAVIEADPSYDDLRLKVDQEEYDNVQVMGLGHDRLNNFWDKVIQYIENPD